MAGKRFRYAFQILLTASNAFGDDRFEMSSAAMRYVSGQRSNIDDAQELDRNFEGPGQSSAVGQHRFSRLRSIQRY